MQKCIKCGKCTIKNLNHDLCYTCWSEKRVKDENTLPKKKFEDILNDFKIPTVYIMFYDKGKYKIGYTNDLNSRLIEIKRKYPSNKLVYFKEFIYETEARLFEVWLKELSTRELNRIISAFQDKIYKVQNLL